MTARALSPGRESLLWKAVCVTLWAAEEIVAGLLIERYSVFQVIWVRFASQGLLMLALWGFARPARLWRTSRPGLQIARAMLMVAMPACWMLALSQGMEPQTLMAVFWTAPVLMLIAAQVWLCERAPPLLWLTAALATLGANLFYVHSEVPTPLAALLALGMACALALFVVATRALRTESLHANLFLTAAGVVLILLPALPGRWVGPGLVDLGLMFAVGLLGFGALYALERMAAAAPVSLTAPATGLQLLPMMGFATLAGQYAWGWRSSVGAALVIGVALILWWREPPVGERPPAAGKLRLAEGTGSE